MSLLKQLRLCVLLLWPAVLLAQHGTQPKELSGPEITDAIQAARVYSKDLFPEFVVDGVKPFNQRALPARKLIFKPGGKLLLTSSSGDQNDKFIIVDTIITSLGGEPPVITWERDTAFPTSPELGSAPNGYYSGGDGAPGTPGTDGQIGNPGFPGRNAPSLYIFFNKIEGPGLKIELRGQDGGPGGPGQKGGDGGNGRAGRPGISSAFDCRSGGQNGGAGGNGGNGGKGGQGGRGGTGGIVIIGSVSETLHLFVNTASVEIQGGKGGKGGEEGAYGEGGEGGQGGSGSAFCGGGSPGPHGKNGNKGGKGDVGQAGVDGTYRTVVLSDEQLISLGVR